MGRTINWNSIGKLPSTSGIYRIGCGKETYYIGSTNNLKRRMAEHKRSGNDGCYVNYIPTRTRKQAYNAERNMIRSKCPPRNHTKPNSCNTSFLDQFFNW